MSRIPFSSKLDVVAIQEMQQNRFPSLFVDCIDELMPGHYAVGFKNFTFNEWFFPSHFPGNPTVPGYILVEAATQVFIMTFLSLPEYKGAITSFISIENFRFHRKVTPGERLVVRAELSGLRRGIARGSVLGKVEDELTISGEIKIGIPKVLDEILHKLGKSDD